jgi:RNA polymerase sigma-70 factor, ECF subfamily
MYQSMSSGDARPPAATAALRAISPNTRVPKEGFQRSSFDGEYIARLRNGDPVTERHFTEYFGELLLIKLRARLRDPQTVEDLRQETFLRVLTALKSKNSLHSPESLGAFVNSVANNLLSELYRGQSRQRTVQPSEDFDPPDRRAGADAEIASEERRRQVRKLLEELPQKDRELLRMAFYEEVDTDEICRLFHVTRGYFRVLMHRAKARLRDCLLKSGSLDYEP